MGKGKRMVLAVAFMVIMVCRRLSLGLRVGFDAPDLLVSSLATIAYCRTSLLALFYNGPASLAA